MKLVHWLLLRLPPETAHQVGKLCLRLYQWLRFSFGPPLTSGPRPLNVRKLPFRFKNRLGLAAGFDKTAEMFPGLLGLGFGFIEVGTVTPLPQEGNPKPRLFRKPGGLLLNHMGFNNCGLTAFRAHIERLRRWSGERPVLANVGKGRGTEESRAVEDYAAALKGLVGVVDGFVCNLSSPNTPGLVRLQSEAFLESLAKASPPEVPIWIKFSPDLDLNALRSILEWVGRSPRFQGVVLTNTSRTLAEQRLQAPQGGLSGPPLLEGALERVALARHCLRDDQTVIGVGGVTTAEDARRMRAAGADLVEIYTSFVYGGAAKVRELSKALDH